MPRLPDILTEQELPLPVLAAARLDGHLTALGTGYLPIDLPETPPRRAQALALLLSPRLTEQLVIVGASARWITGSLAFPPRVHTVSARRGQRVHCSLSGVLRWCPRRQSRFADGAEPLRYGPLWVSVSAPRTESAPSTEAPPSTESAPHPEQRPRSAPPGVSSEAEHE